MLRFLGQFRKKLLGEGKFRKYAPYALGEIILVVVGILIALQINNWNEERKAKIRADNYIEKLINDLVTDTININNQIAINQQAKEKIDAYLSYSEQENVSVQNLLDSIGKLSISLFRYLPINYTFIDMQASGNTSLLNENQRRAMMELSNQQEFLKIIIEKNISMVIADRQEAKKYLEIGVGSIIFAKIVFPENENFTRRGLFHLKNMLKSNSLLYQLMEARGNLIKVKTQEALKTLQE